jgi:hypothetical protein
MIVNVPLNSHDTFTVSNSPEERRRVAPAGEVSCYSVPRTRSRVQFEDIGPKLQGHWNHRAQAPEGVSTLVYALWLRLALSAFVAASAPEAVATTTAIPNATLAIMVFSFWLGVH